MILEYKLDRDFDGLMKTPGWVSNGGQLQDPDTFTMMGFAPAVRQYKIPDSVSVLTLEGAKARAVGIHARYPFRKISIGPPEQGDVMTQQEVEDMVAAIVSANDIA